MKIVPMKNNITNFITALKAENIKKRGTGFYWTSAILGTISPILFFIVLIVMRTDEIKTEIPSNFYQNFINEAVNPFAFFFFPLLIIIIVSRITQLDHKNGGWQLMETQPSYKFSIYFSKFCTVLIANLISIVSFIVVSLFLAWILSFIITMPKMAIMTLPLGFIFHLILRLFLASLLITTLQYIISVLIPSFIWSIVIGFFGLLLTFFLEPFNLTPVWYPYKILSKVAANPDGSDVGHWFTFTEYVGITLSIILLYIGFNWYRNKTLKLTFNTTTKIVSLLIVLVIFGGLTYWLLRPNQMPDYGKTVFCGKIDSKDKFKTLYIKDNTVQDTIAIIAIKDNEFHFSFDKKVIPDNYTFVIDGKYGGDFFFSDHDSIYLDGQIFNQKSKFKIKGTRLAENQMSTESKEEWSTVSFYLEENQNLEKPDIIINALYKEWKEAMEASVKFKTVDNYIPKNDFTERNRKLITTKYLNMWNDLVKKRAALYPNQKTKGGIQIAEIQKNLSLTDESLLSSKEYFAYLTSELIAKNHDDIDDDAKSILAISQMKSGSFRDKMLYWQISKTIEEASTAKERNDFVAKYITEFSNPNYQRKITYVNKMAESLGKGNPAPAFEAVTIAGKPATLSTLKGKFVVLDVWATWCGPCKQESPYFEKFAIKYKKQKVQFVAVSTDENIQKWYIAAKTKSKSVLQLHAFDLAKFSKDYDVVSIPRFILIDTNGNFVNAKMPSPSDPAFEMILRKAMQLPDEE